MRAPVGRHITAGLDAQTPGVRTTRLDRPRTSSHVASSAGACSRPKPCEDAVGAGSYARSALLTVSRPAMLLAPDAVASIAPRPAVRDDRDPPLVSGQGGLCVRQIRISVKWNILAGGLDRRSREIGRVFCPTGEGAPNVPERYAHRCVNHRHCERSDLSAEAFGEGGSNPESLRGNTLDCFVARACLAMTPEVTAAVRSPDGA
ncbi:hypothetical protein GGD65_007467 [Bradyrhizobium sp. CIR18]|nr:hypothetical protein [Bradyrhizobium sp. CIR18]